VNADDNLLVERRDGYLWLTLNRADKANALAVGMMEGAAAALKDAVTDDTVRAVILTGAGHRAFCAGADVREQPGDGDMAAHRKRRSAGLAAFLDAIMDTPKPVVAVLNGIASGGGAMLALLSDARVAVDSAAISLPEINLGMATYTGAAIAMQVGGHVLATDLVQSGRRMPAAEALNRGLVSCVVPREELEAAAVRVAASLAEKDAKAFAANKLWLNRPMKAALAEARAEHERHRKA
jgi:enoyl-CoA hydratase/carnithine racemase